MRRLIVGTGSYDQGSTGEPSSVSLTAREVGRKIQLSPGALV